MEMFLLLQSMAHKESAFCTAMMVRTLWVLGRLGEETARRGDPK